MAGLLTYAEQRALEIGELHVDPRLGDHQPGIARLAGMECGRLDRIVRRLAGGPLEPALGEHESLLRRTVLQIPYFEPLAQDIVSKTKDWQVWSVERRENVFEDHTMADRAKRGEVTPQQLFVLLGSSTELRISPRSAVTRTMKKRPPSRLISRSSFLERAFTTDTPTPCRPPEIL